LGCKLHQHSSNQAPETGVIVKILMIESVASIEFHYAKSKEYDVTEEVAKDLIKAGFAVMVNPAIQKAVSNNSEKQTRKK
jgi:hypothetical protein